MFIVVTVAIILVASLISAFVSDILGLYEPSVVYDSVKETMVFKPDRYDVMLEMMYIR